VYGTITLCGATFQTLPLPGSFVTLWEADALPIESHNPGLATPSGYHTSLV
jgi:hypothetical protein